MNVNEKLDKFTVPQLLFKLTYHKMSSNTSNGFLTAILWLYLTISQVMAIYFWWLYAKENTFISSIFIGPFVAEFKGLFWIFFI